MSQVDSPNNETKKSQAPATPLTEPQAQGETEIFYEATPNPQAMKFILTQPLCDQTLHFTAPLEAERSPLASKIFGFPWCDGVSIGPNFVTVTKQDWVDWQILADPLAEIIKEHVVAGNPILLPEAQEASEPASDDSPEVKLIKKVIQEEIRPAVAMDGGDIIFHKYENKIVYVYMRGACAGCPSSTITLKQGIEVRLKNALPEIQEVVSS